LTRATRLRYRPNLGEYTVWLVERSPSSNQAATVGGLVLVGLGLVFLAQQALGFDLGHFGWPLVVMLPGVAMLAAFALGPRGAGGLAVPGCVVTTVGLILAVQNTFGVWQTWAYAWGLVVAAVGAGLRLQGERLDQPRLMATGLRLLEGGLLGFLVFAVFFEFVLDLSHLAGGTLKSVVGPAVLILAGLYLLFRRRARPVSGA
jgi:hypothetical protein